MNMKEISILYNVSIFFVRRTNFLRLQRHVQYLGVKVDR
jgi:hypothetical protein